MNTKKSTEFYSFLGYDPIEKDHKVLAVTETYERTKAHQVMTLGGDGNMTWRLVKFSLHHFQQGLILYA